MDEIIIKKLILKIRHGPASRTPGEGVWYPHGW